MSGHPPDFDEHAHSAITMPATTTAAAGWRCDANESLSRKNGRSSKRHDTVASTTANASLTGNNQSGARIGASTMPNRAATAVTIVSAGRCKRYSPKQSLPRYARGAKRSIAVSCAPRSSTVNITTLAQPNATTE